MRRSRLVTGIPPFKTIVKFRIKLGCIQNGFLSPSNLSPKDFKICLIKILLRFLEAA